MSLIRPQLLRAPSFALSLCRCGRTLKEFRLDLHVHICICMYTCSNPSQALVVHSRRRR
eukprot:jgi/Botrbrau1/22789/Bobra.0132s0115.1